MSRAGCALAALSVGAALSAGCSKSTDAEPPSAPDSTRTYTYTVIDSFPHDSTAYTQGLAFGPEGYLYEGTGLYGGSSLRRVELTTGRVDTMIGLAALYFGEGIALLGNRIVQLTWRENSAFVWNRASFAREGQFSYAGEGWGLTFDGSRFIMSNGGSALQFRDTATFEIRRSAQVRDDDGPVDRLNELEYIDGEVWANIWLTDWIARIDPDDGRVTGYVDLTGLLSRTAHPTAEVLNGIAWDSAGARLFVTGKYWPWLYQIEVREAP